MEIEFFLKKEIQTKGNQKMKNLGYQMGTSEVNRIRDIGERTSGSEDERRNYF